MTVSTTVTRVIYSPTGAETEFAVPFPFFDAGDLEVIERDIATGAETAKALGADYTVAGGQGATGTVTAAAPPPATVQWAIRRATPLTQEIDYVENDPFPAAAHEEGLDRAVMRAQEAAEETGRALKFPVSDGTGLVAEIPSSVARADRVLAFDGAGAPVASARTLGEIEGQIGIAEGHAEDAAASAGAAAGAAVEAGLHAVNAEAGADAAADSAADAATSLAAAGLPDPAVAGTYLRRDVGNTAYEARTPDEVRADIGALKALFDVTSYGATGDGFTDDAPAIQSALNDAESAGGGRLYFPRGTYLLGAGLIIDSNNVFLMGEGSGVSILKLDDAVDDHAVSYLGTSLSPIFGGGVLNLEIDGNRSNNTLGHGIRLAWTSDWLCEGYRVHDTAAYGIGAQAGTLRRIKIGHGIIEDTGADGVDFKNTEDNNLGILITGVTITRPGRDGGLSTQAGIDLRGPCQVSDCHVRDFGDIASTTGIRFREGELLDPNGVGGHNSTATNCYVEANTKIGTVGFDVAARQVRISGAFAGACGEGFKVRQAECTMTGCQAVGCADGFVTKASTGLASDGDRVSMTSCIARSGNSSGEDGFVIEADNCMVVACLARSKDTGFITAVGANQTIFVANTSHSNTTANFTDGGTNTVSANNVGFV